jgi:serine/threonine-protein kinase
VVENGVKLNLWGQAANGQREPIWLFEQQVLDGRNRLAACKLAGVEPKFKEFKGAPEEAIRLVWSLNFKRRHLTPSQAGACVVEFEDLLAKFTAQAKAVQKTGKGADGSGGRVNGGGAITICPAGLPFGMSWDDLGIAFGQAGGAIMRVSANGGKPEVLVPVKDGEVAHGPQALPDGEFVVFTLTTATGTDRWDKAQIVAQSFRSGERKVLIEGGSDARYVPTGHIVYAVFSSLFATRFDVRRLEAIGGPVPIVEGVRRGTNLAGSPPTTHFSISGTGSLVYIPGPVRVSTFQRELAFVDRSGQVVPLKLPFGSYEAPRISPDGRRVAFGSDDGKEASVWVYKLSGTTSMRKLTLAGANRYPTWARDSQRVVFQSDREGDLGIF